MLSYLRLQEELKTQIVGCTLCKAANAVAEWVQEDMHLGSSYKPKLRSENNR